ncbi:unnamed protein product [Didymodactylos carnosus]|uniref:Anoctamin n=1 Tax=Didymodactylos carnosus TaxID=1234261 RepID=A0A8S2H7Q1_9BILA|nr:unnamed protein product [Didymodactylos carnosus]CAF3610611.1 unnamed protein product [Didymodactylos carnosus]
MSYSRRFEPLVVVEFSSSARNDTKQWLLRRITASRQENGAELLASIEADSDNKNNIMYVGALTDRLLEGGEELQIKKRYKDGTLREFLVADIKNFENGDDPDNFLSMSTKQRIIWEELQNLRPEPHEHAVPGAPMKSIDQNDDTILGLLKNLDYIVNVFPLHDKEELKRLEHTWYMTSNSWLQFKPLPIRQVRDYFGENVAFYFAFLEYYTKSLVVPAIIGIIVRFFPCADFLKYSFYCIFNVFWWTIFMERWKRLGNKLAFEWGALDVQIFERPRPLYHGPLVRSPITNKLERRYPPWKRQLKKYLITYPVIMICLSISLTIYFTYYRIQKRTNEQLMSDHEKAMSLSGYGLRIVPSAGYSLLVTTITLAYKRLSILLTDFENHRLQSSYENNNTAKLFIFYFMNCFIGLFYEAFFNMNYGNVAQLLITMLVVNALINKFVETIAPYIAKKFKKGQLNKHDPTHKPSDIEKQTKLLTTFNVFPWVTICALINNIFELRADAFKFCHVFQRPFAQLVSNIGSWHYAFDVMSSVAVVTNTALIAMHPSVRDYFSGYSDIEYILMFVAAEHILLTMKYALMFAIPDTPMEVEIERARSLYESMQALKRESLSADE